METPDCVKCVTRIAQIFKTEYRARDKSIRIGRVYLVIFKKEYTAS